jgi:hypothetical protein
MNFDKTPTPAQLGVLVLAIIFAVFTAALIEGEVPPPVSSWFSLPVHESNLSTAELSETILQPSDLPGNYTVVERRVRSLSDVSPIARNLGWKRGVIVRYQLAGPTAYCGPSIQQIISVYPPENITRALPHPQYHKRIAQENNENVLVEELPEPGIGDASTATKITQKEYVCSACLIDFTKNDVYSQIMVYGPAPDCESAKKLAERAAAKIN